MYRLEFTDNEIIIILNALDFYSRIWIGQYDEVLWELRWSKNCHQLDELDQTLCRKLWTMRSIVLPGLSEYHLSGSYGIFSPDRDIKAAIAYDMQQEFRYKRAWFMNPEGGNSVDFGKPLPCEDDPCVFPKAECYSINGNFSIKVYINDSQISIIIDALNISAFEREGQIRKIFEYYTSDSDALKIADELTDILAAIETEREVKNDLHFELIQRLSSSKVDNNGS